jgi:hypothetical protein
MMATLIPFLVRFRATERPMTMEVSAVDSMSLKRAILGGLEKRLWIKLTSSAENYRVISLLIHVVYTRCRPICKLWIVGSSMTLCYTYGIDLALWIASYMIDSLKIVKWRFTECSRYRGNSKRSAERSGWPCLSVQCGSYDS